MVFIKNSIDSEILTPVFAEVLKLPQNSPFFANSSNSGSSKFCSSKRSTLFSTKRQGNFPPSKNTAASSTDFFHLIVVYYYILKDKILTLLLSEH